MHTPGNPSQGHGDGVIDRGVGIGTGTPKTTKRYAKQTKFARVTGREPDGALRYSHVGPAAQDWNYATNDRWNPFLATTDQPFIGNTSAATEDATRVYSAHRANDADRVPAGSLNDVLVLPCRVHQGGQDADGNPIRRLMIGFDKAEFYAGDQLHGTLAHRGPESLPGDGYIPVKTWFYYHAPSHQWRLKTAVFGGGGPGPEPTPKAPSTPPPPSPGSPVPTGRRPTQPTGGGTPTGPGPTQPTGGGVTDPSNGNATPFDGDFDVGFPDGFNPFPDVGDRPPINGGMSGNMMQMRLETSERDNQVAQTTGYRTRNNLALRSTARLTVAGRSQLGPLHYTGGVESVQSQPARSWMGRGPHTDVALLAAELTALDWSVASATTKYTQAQSDALHPYSAHTSYVDHINALSDHVQELNAVVRSHFSEAQLVTVASGTQSITVSTTYAVANAAVSDLKVVATPIDSKVVIDSTGYTLNGDNTVTVTLQLTGTPVTDTEINVVLAYPIARSTTLTLTV